MGEYAAAGQLSADPAHGAQPEHRVQRGGTGAFRHQGDVQGELGGGRGQLRFVPVPGRQRSGKLVVYQQNDGEGDH